MRRLRSAGLLLAALLPLAAHAETLTVSAAASLTQAFTELGKQFEATTPDTEIKLNFASSGTLLQQIIQGAPVDVFASADQDTMNRAVAAKVIDLKTRQDFARNDLVVVTPLKDGVQLTGLQDLTQDGVERIAIGRPVSVPAGRYAQQALENAGLWSRLEPKYVQGASVRQVLDYVSRGEVEAGFVYRTDAALMPDTVRIALTASGHDPVSYPVAVIADSRQAELAKRFIQFLSSEPAQAVLAHYGFAKP